MQFEDCDLCKAIKQSKDNNEKSDTMGRNFITKVFTHFCSKNVLLLTRNCCYQWHDYYKN